VRNDSGIFFDAIGYTQEDIDYADYQITLWTNFAKYGNPTPEPVKPPYNAEPVTWEKFSIDDNLKILDLDRQVVIQENFRQQRDAFFYDYLSSILERPIKSENPSRSAGGFRFDSQRMKDAMQDFVTKTLTAKGINIPV